MVRNLTLKNSKTGARFSISRNAQIGRNATIAWAVDERERPPVADNLEMAVTVKGDNMVSRNYAAVVIDENSARLYDLNSANGTYVNGERVSSRGCNLRLGDLINLGGAITALQVEQIFSDLNYRALLVGNDGGNLRGVENDLRALEKLLRERGFTEVSYVNVPMPKTTAFRLWMKAH